DSSPGVRGGAEPRLGYPGRRPGRPRAQPRPGQPRRRPMTRAERLPTNTLRFHIDSTRRRKAGVAPSFTPLLRTPAGLVETRSNRRAQWVFAASWPAGDGGGQATASFRAPGTMVHTGCSWEGLVFTRPLRVD